LLELLKFIIDESPHGIFIVDNNNKISYANKNFINIIEYDNIENSYYIDIFQGNISDYFVSDVKKIKINDIIKNNNQKITINATKFNKNIVCFCNNNMPKKLKNYENNDFLYANELKSSFLSNISHSIKTPLNIIIGFSNLLLKSNTNEQKRKYFNVIKKSSNTLSNFIDNLLDISKIETKDIILKNNKCELLNIIYDVYEKYKSTTNIKLLIDDNLTNVIIYSDCFRIKQILDNIINNAIKFTNKGHVKIGYSIEIKNIIFWVEDTGIGIPNNKFDYIFEKFTQIDEGYSKKYPGGGLGLSITKKLVNIMGGEIWLKSTINKGTTFYFSIPSDFSQKID